MFIFFILTGCRNIDSGILNESDKKPSVETYLSQLKSNTYNSSELPAFEPGDIPCLLRYCSDTQRIHVFPHNPISSLIGPDCRLGMIVLWTIESIRVTAIDSGIHIGRFPSQNPILAKRNSEKLELVDIVNGSMSIARTLK